MLAQVEDRRRSKLGSSERSIRQTKREYKQAIDDETPAQPDMNHKFFKGLINPGGLNLANESVRQAVSTASLYATLSLSRRESRNSGVSTSMGNSGYLYLMK